MLSISGQVKVFLAVHPTDMRKSSDTLAALVQDVLKLDPLRLARIVAQRQARSVPVLKQFGDWLEAESPRVLPKSPMREALDYARNNWTALNQCARHGQLAIDNNVAERALRGIAIGRRNWLFLGSDRGGRAAAMHFSLIASCLRNNVEPFAYLRDLLTRRPVLLPGASRDTLRSLLPDRWQLAK